MSDRLRELVGDPYSDLYDCDPYPALLAEQEQLLAELKECQANGLTHPTCPPWGTIEQDIADTERCIANLRAKIEAGITTAAQDRAMTLDNCQ